MGGEGDAGSATEDAAIPDGAAPTEDAAIVDDAGLPWDATAPDAGCAAGLQDNDGDGECLPDCLRADGLPSIACGNGSCDSSSGTAVCLCDDGYAGTQCDACAAGYQDSDGDGVCELGCGATGADALDCGPGGACAADASTGVRGCVCDEGYELGTGTCDACARGYTAGAGGVCALELPHTTNLWLWLDASNTDTLSLTAAGTVGAWGDARPAYTASREVTQSIGSARPTFVPRSSRVGARPSSVRFDGGDQLVMANGFWGVSTADYEVIIALNSTATPSGVFSASDPSASGDYSVMIDQHQSSDYRYIHRQIPAASGGNAVVANRSEPRGPGWVVASHSASATIDLMHIIANDLPTDVIDVSSTEAEVGIAQRLQIGRTPLGFMNGDIYEVLVYVRSLTVAEREEVIDYLAAKWRLPFSIAP
ncbi:MAG: hypothetical protein OEY14_16025 [Myxococcales bacterium]|nr:hypothetical protein [Myxococcales bacterium]